MSLLLERLENETWRDAALRVAKQQHLEAEVAEAYDAYIKQGSQEAHAAWSACYEWDVLRPAVVHSETARASSGSSEGAPPGADGAAAHHASLATNG